MKINKIKINNFYSFHDVELKFDDYSGLVLIEGKNKDTGGSNGSGKSSLIEAVVWGLFGKTVRNSTEEAMINFTNKKNCTVELIINGNIKGKINQTKKFPKTESKDSPRKNHNIPISIPKLIAKKINQPVFIFM